MRTDIYPDRIGWIYRLDYKKFIVIIFLLRLILASAYDIAVTLTDKDPLLPDSKFYSLRGRYVSLVFEGYGMGSFTKDLLPLDRAGKEMFIENLRQERGGLPRWICEANIHSFMIGALYFIFGYSTIWVRILNICLSIFSVYLLFRVAKRHFGDLTANLFLVAALLLPTQVGYSITLSRDFLRMVIVSVSIWFIYNIGDICVKKLRPLF